MSLSPAVRQMIAGLSGELARLSDAELLARFISKREEAAFAALVERHGPTVLGVCRRTLGHVQDAEDAAQAVFLVLARNARRVRKPAALSAWLHGVAVRVSRKVLARRRTSEPLPEALPATAQPDPTWADARRVIDESLATLPDSLRVPLVLCYLEGLTRDEAAARLGWSLDTFRGRLERGREKLRALLARRGFPLSAGLIAVLLESPAAASPTWVSTTAAQASGSAPLSPVIASLSAGVLPMKLPRYWPAGGALIALAFGGALWAGSAPQSVVSAEQTAPPPRPAAVADEPAAVLPKDRTGVWRTMQVSPDGNTIESRTIRFTSATELVWDWQRRAPGEDSRSGARYKYAVTAAGKLELTMLATLQADGLEWAPFAGRKLPPTEYTILPLDKEGQSFQLVHVDSRGRKTTDAVYRKEVDAQPAADPLVPEYLTKIDRTIKKEPKYDNDPKYALAAFGPKAEFKVWVVLDGDVVYIDCNGNGDLTEKGERMKADVPQPNIVRSATAGLTYRLPGTDVTMLFPNWTASPQGRTSGYIGVFNGDHFSQIAGLDSLNYAPSPETAAVIHFGSPIVTVRPSPRTAYERNWRFAIPDANRETQVLFEVGTPGVGAGNRTYGVGSFAAFTHTDGADRRRPALLPKEANPVVEYEFKPLNPADGVKKVTVKLTDRVGEIQFAGKVKVPDGVKTGVNAAKMTLSFPDCPWGKVEPTTHFVDVFPKGK